MSVDKNGEQIYIVISQTGTVLSRLLKLITGAEYNHASIALKQDLELMYSFGRLNPYNPFWGGFVTESPNFGTFKRFFNTKVIVLAVSIDGGRYDRIKEHIEEMRLSPKSYHYNYLGLCLAAFKIVYKSRNRFYCSEFVKDVLQTVNVEGADKLSEIIKPVDFLCLPKTTRIYQGKLSDYAVEAVETKALI